MQTIKTNQDSKVSIDSKESQKRVYHTPRLSTFGTIAELTETTSTFSGSDGGGFPNMYGS